MAGGVAGAVCASRLGTSLTETAEAAAGSQAKRPAASLARHQSTAHAPLPDPAEGGTVVCVTSGKGGVGKTTTSAVCAASHAPPSLIPHA